MAGAELTLPTIADATLTVIGDGGVDSLTRARVAAQLGVSVRALYRLAPTVDHLIAEAAMAWQRRWALPPDTGAWCTDLRQWCIASRAHAAAYPGLTAAVQRLPPELVGDATGPVTEAVIARLEGAGFELAEARSLFGVLSMHCLGWAVIFPDVALQDMAHLPNDVVEAHRAFRKEGFIVGLDLLLEGIAGRLEGRGGSAG